MAESNISHVIVIPGDAWGLALGIGLIGGFIGGLGAALQVELDNARRDQVSILFSGKSRAMCIEHLLGRGCIGAAASVGGLFIILLSPITASFGNGAFWAFLAGASTVFGVFAKRLLPAIENSLTERFGLMREEIAKVHEEVASNSGLDRTERALDDALSVWAVRSDIKKQAAVVEEYIKRMPRTRRPVFGMHDCNLKS